MDASLRWHDGEKMRGIAQLTEDRLKDETFRRMNVEMTPHTRLGNVDDIAATITVDGGRLTTKYLSEFAPLSVFRILRGVR